MEDSGMRDLNLSPAGSDEYKSGKQTGQKQCASSEAAREDRPTGSGNTDLYHRRSAASFASSYGLSAASSMEAELCPVSLSKLHHQRVLSEHEHPQIRKMSTDSILNSRQNSVSGHIPSAYVCECCPKKPKKFDSEEELR
jgi:hypothetical protein